MDSIPNVLLLIESSRESGRKLISGIADYANHFGPWRFAWQAGGLTAGFSPEIKKGTYHGVLARDVADYKFLKDKGIPSVLFSYQHKTAVGDVFVQSDDAGIAETVATYFLRRGFRNFAFCSSTDAPWSMSRGQHFQRALERESMGVDYFQAMRLETGKEKMNSQNRRIQAWLEKLPRPVALMADNDDTAFRVLQVCRSAGLRVPEDCAVVGVDNDPVICGMSTPQLSSVSFDQHHAGYLAAAQLDRMMRGKKPETRMIMAEVEELVVRQSSDIIALDDPAMVKAVSYIQRNASRKILVDEVAKAAGVHRRALERRFQTCFGHGIKMSCREMRAEYLEKLFRNPGISFEQIAGQCGFSEPGHLTRFYAAIRGETPSAYRKRCARF